MRLLNAKTLELEDFPGQQVPPYSILSHTWGDEEVTYQELRDYSASVNVSDTADSGVHFGHALTQREGFRKIQGLCEATLGYNLTYTWVDTACIDKTSSAELSESINSMYKFYQKARVCLVYLSDLVDSEHEPTLYFRMAGCRWFKRGWCLQELLAPSYLEVFTRSWTKLGSRSDLAMRLSSITGIEEDYLIWKDIHEASVGKRMSWASRRSTTRVEDMAYCLLGIFEVNMPLLYGEGTKAFQRLQEEIMRGSDDQSLFAWGTLCDLSTMQLARDLTPGLGIYDLLAPSPKSFAHSGPLASYPHPMSDEILVKTHRGIRVSMPIGHTRGFRSLPLPYSKRLRLAALACQEEGHAWNIVAIPIYEEEGAVNVFSRFAPKGDEPYTFLVPRSEWIDDGTRTIYVQGPRPNHQKLLPRDISLLKGRPETSAHFSACPTSPLRIRFDVSGDADDPLPVRHLTFRPPQVDHLNKCVKNMTFPFFVEGINLPLHITLNLDHEAVSIHAAPQPLAKRESKLVDSSTQTERNGWHAMTQITTIHYSHLTFDVLWWADNAGPKGHRYRIGLDCWMPDEIKQCRVKEIRRQQHFVMMSGWTKQDVVAQAGSADALAKRNKRVGVASPKTPPKSQATLPVPFAMQRKLDGFVSRIPRPTRALKVLP